MQADVTAVTERLYRECGGSKLCRSAVEYYVAVVKNPCHPPPRRLAKNALRYYAEFVRRYGLPRCDVKALVEERLRGTALEKYAHEAAEFAELLKRTLNITSRVAAAAAVIVVAERHGINVIRYAVAARFGASDTAVRTWLRRAFKLYAERAAAGKV
jgi:hypothetical protein